MLLFSQLQVNENVVSVMKNILDVNWNTPNVAKPLIEEAWDMKRIDARQGDFITLYETAPLTRVRGDVFYESEDVDGFVSIDIRTMQGEPRLDALYQEVERIRRSRRRNPEHGYDLIYFIRKTNLNNKTIKLFRCVVDVRLLRRKIII